MGLGTRCPSCQKRIADFQVGGKLAAEGRSDVDTCSIADVEDCMPPASPVGFIFGGELLDVVRLELL